MTAIAAQPAPQGSPTPVTEPIQPATPWLAQVMLDTIGRSGARLGLIWVLLVAFFAAYAPLLANSHPLFLKTNDPQLVAKYGHVSSPLLRYLSGADVTLMIFGIGVVALWASRRLVTSAKLMLGCLLLAVLVPATHWQPLGQYIGDVYHRQGLQGELTRAGQLWRLGGLGVLLLIDFSVIFIALWTAIVPTRLKAWAVAILFCIIALLIIFPVNPPVLSDYTQYRKALAAGHIERVVFAPIPYSANDRLNDQFDLDNPPPRPPSRKHWLGTEEFGADILSRMMHACRVAMAIGFIATGISIAIGVVIGGLMGYFVGWFDLIGMRLVEIFGSIPTLYLLLAFVAFFERNLYMMMVIIGLTSWVENARFVRAEFLRLRNQDFVQAARAGGLKLRSILFRHMLPNAMAPLLVSASFGIAVAILYESTLSFLGLGLVEDPSWGQLLNQAISDAGVFSWWLATFPGLAIFLTVFAYNLIGEAVRDALDPTLKRTG